MWWILSCLLAHGGEVIVDAKVPVHLAVDGVVVAEVYTVGVLKLPVDAGKHTLTLTTGGTPAAHEIDVGDQPVVVIVGRTGTSVGTLAEGAPEPSPASTAAAVAAAPAPTPEVAASAAPALLGPVPVRFRTAGRARLLVQIDTRRYTVAPGEGIDVDLSAGEHIVSVRNPEGTQIYARGVLTVTGGGDLVVQVAEGRVPETSGNGLAFYATSR
ncbi:MAG: hypothetical protein H6732_03460 [Alphaproteobacteria bacterium]|nr:hypothetical protein [Alphaproteobacteria bacterium]